MFSLARGLLLILLVAGPLAFGSVQPWAWAAITVLAVLSFFVWTLGCIQQKVLPGGLSGLYITGGLFLLWGLLQLSFHLSVDAIATREALVKLSTYLIILFLARTLYRDNSEKLWFACSLIVTVFAFSLSVFAILQAVSRPDLIFWSIRPKWGGYIFGPYVNHNHYAGLMEMLIPIQLMWFIHAINQPYRWLIAFAVSISSASVLLSGSRAGLIALGIESAAIVLMLLAQSHKKDKKLTTSALLAVAFAVGLGFWLTPLSVLQRFKTLATSPEVTFRMRQQMSHDAFRMFKDHPWVGTGLGSFETSYTAYQTLPIYETIDHAHNDFVEALAETGLPGLILIVVSLVIFAKSASQNFRGPFTDLARCIRLGATLGCCGILVHSFSDFNLHIPANAAWFAFCLGLSQIKLSSLDESSSRGLRSSAFGQPRGGAPIILRP